MVDRVPFFSVVIPTYNRSSVLPRAIDSVLSQSLQDFELIVVDDGSTDDTESIIQKYSDKLKYCKVENRGVSAARNIGATNTNGKYLAFLDSDDEWLPNKLQVQAEYFNNNPKSKLVHSNEIWIRNGKRVNQMKKHAKQGGDFFERALELCLISPSAVVIERDFYFKHKGFYEDYEVCEDYDLWLRMKTDPEIGEILYHNEPLIKKYGGHDDQLSRKYFAMDLWRVRSMYRLLQEVDLNKIRLEALVQVLLKKCEILIKGYKKHDNLEHIEFLENIQKHCSNVFKE